jgi:hypothetical protein
MRKRFILFLCANAFFFLKHPTAFLFLFLNLKIIIKPRAGALNKKKKKLKAYFFPS